MKVTFEPALVVVTVLMLAGCVYMTPERREAKRLWRVNLEAAIRAGDLDRAESLFAEQTKVPLRTSLDLMSADIAANEYAFERMVSLGRSYEAGERDSYGYCDLSADMNRALKNEVRYRFPQSLRQFVVDRCNGIREEELLAAAASEAREYGRNASEELALEKEAAERRGRAKAKRVREENAKKARIAADVEAESERLSALGYPGIHATRVSTTILNLMNRRISQGDLGHKVFGCGRIVKIKGERCHRWDTKIKVLQVIDASVALYSFDEWRGSTNYEFIILVEDTIEPGQTVTGMPIPRGYYTLQGTRSYETALGSTNTVYAIERVE